MCGELAGTGNWATGIPRVTDYDVRYFQGQRDPVIQAHWVEPDDSGGHNHVGAATSTTIAGLLNDATYVVQVRAANQEGTSAWSASGRGTTRARVAVSGVVLGSKPRIDTDDDGTNDTYGVELSGERRERAHSPPEHAANFKTTYRY